MCLLHVYIYKDVTSVIYTLLLGNSQSHRKEVSEDLWEHFADGVCILYCCGTAVSSFCHLKI